MGYRCPVCADPQADDVHLANHLAFTALTRGGEHESWLDDHVPDWGQLDDDGLAEEVTALADEAEYPRIFEDTTDSDHDHDHTDDVPEGTEIPQGVGDLPGAASDDDIQEIIEEAREMTQQRRDTTDEDDDSADDSQATEDDA